MSTWRIDLLPDGRIVTLHHDDVAALVQQLGVMRVQRISNVEFDITFQDWKIEATTNATRKALWPAMCQFYTRRTDAIAHEVATLTQMSDSYGELL